MELYAWTKGKIFLGGPTQEIPSEHLREVSGIIARVANQNAGFASSRGRCGMIQL